MKNKTYKRCETCVNRNLERSPDGKVPCNLDGENHSAFDKCLFWENGGFSLVERQHE